MSATFAYNPASQITSTVRTGDTYAWTGHGNGSTDYVSNGLNQLTSIGGAAASWDSRGNLITEPQSAKSYTYSSENLLKTATGGVTLGYDPALRLYQVAGAATTRFAYDGLNAIAEYNGSNVLQRRFVFGSGMDEAIVQYEGTGTTDRRFLSADERGSIISLTNTSGTLLGINRYDEYGKPQSTNIGRFQYTGQKWIGEINLYDYKFRMYAAHPGIFVQPDPIGYAGDGPNLYAYVLNDPVNSVDPLGLRIVWKPNYACIGEEGFEVCGWTGYFTWEPDSPGPIGGNLGSVGGGGGGGGGGGLEDASKRCSTGLISEIGDVFGKLNASPATALGLVAGSAGYIAGRLQGTNPSVAFGNNAIQFTGSPLNVNGRAFTLGNVQVYGATGPEAFVRSYSGNVVNLGRHEEAHTYQSQWLGLGGYVAAHAYFGIGTKSNPLEASADDYARGQSCTGF